MSSTGNLFIFEDNNYKNTSNQYDHTDSEFQKEADDLETQSARGREVQRNRCPRRGRGRGGYGAFDRPSSVGPPLRPLCYNESAIQRQINRSTRELNDLRIDADETTIDRDDDVNNHTITYERQPVEKTGGRGGFQRRFGEKPTKTLKEKFKWQEKTVSEDRQIRPFVRRDVLGNTDNDADKVFDFMVRKMAGSGAPREICRQSGLLPKYADLEMWFRQRKDKFVLIEKDNSIHTVLVYDKATTFCFDYTRQSCSRENCHRYHVCKDLLAGKCMYGPRKCKFSHYFFDPHNMTISEKLGYKDKNFTDEDIVTILKVSQPHVCIAWALNLSCTDESCIDLHICPRYILGRCNDGPGCSLCHDRLSEHNKPIVCGFGMSEMPYGLFRNQVFLTKELAWDRTEPAFRRTPSGTGWLKSNSSEGTQENKGRFDRRLTETKAQINIDMDEAGDKNLCDLQLIGKCRRERCDNLHGDGALPYLWQIHLYGSWTTLGTGTSETVEKAFCKNSDEIALTAKDIPIVGRLYFSQNSRIFFVDEHYPDIENQARRLSTMSYKEQPADGQDSFKTQWLWYWEDNKQWLLFEPDALQHTLEAKFAAKQSVYIYCREDNGFTYVINFKKMNQVNINTGNKRNIARRPVFVSAEDVKKKIFPMRLTDPPVIDVALPEGWTPWDVAQPFEMVNIVTNKSEADEVFKYFFKTIDEKRMTISFIFRIQNHELWRHFGSQERTMEVNARRMGRDQVIDKRYLFHGTDSWEAVKGICINNFDARVSGKNATMFGDGAYFARDAKYSHAYTKGPRRFIFMANVLVGQYTKGDKSYRRPPAKPGSDHELYDSCVDDVQNPSVFVVFDKNQYYPEYLIEYEDIPETSDMNQSQQQQLTKPPLPKPRNVQHVSFGQSPSSVVDVQSQRSARNLHILDTGHSGGSCLVPRIALPPDLHAQDATKDGYRVANLYTSSLSSDIDSGIRPPRYNKNASDI